MCSYNKTFKKRIVFIPISLANKREWGSILPEIYNGGLFTKVLNIQNIGVSCKLFPDIRFFRFEHFKKS